MQRDKDRGGGAGDRLPDRCDVACMRKRRRVSGEQVMEQGCEQTQAGGGSARGTQTWIGCCLLFFPTVLSLQDWRLVFQKISTV